MKIALLVHDFDRAGGHSRYVSALAEAFAREHEVHVFANTLHGRLPDGVRFHRVRSLRASALATILSFPFFAGTSRADFDIVHAQGFSALDADVVSAHICQGAWRTARRGEGDWGLRERISSAALQHVERWWYRRAPVVIAVSEQVRRELALHYRRVERVHVIHHGVDLDEFCPIRCERRRPAMRRALGLDREKFTGLYVGDLRKSAKALAGLLARVSDLFLVCVSRSNTREIRRYARAYGDEGRLSLRPPTGDIVDYYAAADVFIFPTVYDAFGMVVSEAMACGLPVITTRAAGASELIEAGQDAVVLDSPRDVDGLAESVRNLMANPSRRQAMAEAGRRKIERYPWSRAARETMRVYQEVLDGRRGSRAG
ncbi:MAG: glycosyltransferase family 4 protein [Acidobacteria bacterium]|nr:glycosyltransferase family 4 protein [Acidobacteriota bacterium]